MKAEFDMTLFLSPVLKGAQATRQRHIRQAERMQEVIRERWSCATPWSWRDKHVRWFLEHYLRCSAPGTVYYYGLTARLISCRKAQLGKRTVRPSCVLSSRLLLQS
jgi:hypothetical protein